MIRDKDMLIEMPEELLRNPPEPKRKDIADLFSMLIKEDERSDVFDKSYVKKTDIGNEYKFKLVSENKILFYRKKNLSGFLNNNIFCIFISVKKLMKFIGKKYENKIIKIINPYKSKVLNSILEYMDIKEAVTIKLQLKYIDNTANLFIQITK